jgi:hypothetical protein
VGLWLAHVAAVAPGEADVALAAAVLGSHDWVSDDGFEESDGETVDAKGSNVGEKMHSGRLRVQFGRDPRGAEVYSVIAPEVRVDASSAARCW